VFRYYFYCVAKRIKEKIKDYHAEIKKLAPFVDWIEAHCKQEDRRMRRRPSVTCASRPTSSTLAPRRSAQRSKRGRHAKASTSQRGTLTPVSQG